MKLGIMQPYFFPYIGYWQLINSVDVFVIYDNIQYTKKGWINRNRILINGEDAYITIPLKKSSDYFDVSEKYISENFDRKKLLNQIKGAYTKAPYFNSVYPILSDIINYDEDNLFKYIHNSIVKLTELFGIKSKIIISSNIDIDHELKGQDKVLAICNELNAKTYINAIGGQALYDKDEFLQRNVDLQFIKSEIGEYQQFKGDFISNLSIIDVMMFNSPEQIRDMLDRYELI